MISVPKHFPLCSSKTTFVESDAFDKYLLGLGSSSLASERVVCRAVESCSRATHQEVSQRSGDAATLCVEVVKLLVCMANFSKKAAEVVTLDFRRATACLCQGKWSKFLHWYREKNLSMQGHFSADSRVLSVSAEGAAAYWYLLLTLLRPLDVRVRPRARSRLGTIV